MGCHSSFPIDGAYDARLPVKPHVRNTYSAAPGPGRHTLGQDPGPSPLSVSQQGTQAQHNVCILHSSTGSPWAQGLSEVLNTNNHLTVWCPADQQRLGPAWSRASATGGKAEEIKPYKDNLRASGCAESVTVAQVVAAVSQSSHGLIILVSAGSTWDELILGCLRHPFIKERPLALLHAPESCPAPNMSDWPADIQQALLSRSTPMFTFIASYAQYGAHQVVASLLQQAAQFRKQREAAKAAAAADMAAAAAEARGAVAAAGISAADLQLSTQRSSMDSKEPGASTSTCSIEPPANDSSDSLTGTSTDSRVVVTAPGSIAGTTGGTGKLEAGQPPSSGLSRSATAASDNPWTHMQRQLELLKRRSNAVTHMAAKLASLNRHPGAEHMHDESPFSSADDVDQLVQQPDGTKLLGPLVLAAHHPNMLAPVMSVAKALAPYFAVTIVDGSGSMLFERQARRTLHHVDSRRRDVSASGAFPAPPAYHPHPMAVPEQVERTFDHPNHTSTNYTTTTTGTANMINLKQQQHGSSTTTTPGPQSSPEPVTSSGITLELGAISTKKAPGLPTVASATELERAAATTVSPATLLPSLPPLFNLPHMRIPSTASGVASSLLGQHGKLAGSRHSRSISVGAGPFAFDNLHMYTPPSQSPTIQEEPPPCPVVNCLSTEARTVVSSAKHYVLFSGYNLGTASSLALAEVQAALHAGATVHVVCEASFNLVTPDTRHWPLTPEQASQLSNAWLNRLLWYPDHVDPFLAELCTRLVQTGSRGSVHISSVGSSRTSSTMHVRSSLTSSGGAVGLAAVVGAGVGTGVGHSSLGRTASELLAAPVVVDLCMRLSSSRPQTRTSIGSHNSRHLDASTALIGPEASTD